MFQLQAKSAIQKYIQEKSDIAIDKLNVKKIRGPVWPPLGADKESKALRLEQRESLALRLESLWGQSLCKSSV